MINIKNTKLIKHTLIIILIFLILTILPTAVSFLTSKVKAADYEFEVDNKTNPYYEFGTITGKTWRTNESIARLYDYLYDIDPNIDKLPSTSELQNRDLFIGSSLSNTSGNEFSFHRSGCILDCGTGKDSAVNILCFEPSKWTFESGNASIHQIRQILYITPTSATFYKQTSGNNYKIYETNNLEGFSYQDFLSEAYKSQTNLNAATNFAKYFTGDSAWMTNLNNRFGDTNAIESGFYEKYSGTKLNYKDDTFGFKYSGIFIWYAGNKGMDQGRMTYRVVREKSIPKVNLTINKTDSLTGDMLPGVKFKLELTNVASIDNYQVPTTGQTQNSPKVVYVTTDPSGQIKLTGMEPSNVNNDITVKITEMKVASTDGTHYYKSIDPITITIESANGKYSEATTSNSSISEIIDIKNNNVTVRIENQPLIDISGKVWLDGQTGEKNVAGPNGNKDQGEAGINGVYVRLIDASNEKVFGERYTETNKDGIVGAYEFTQVPQTNAGYIVQFSYDGINYIETKAYADDAKKEGHGTASDAYEIDRDTFNAGFKTISAGLSNDGTTLSYTYSDNASTLNVNIDGTNPATNSADFRMQARTDAYNTTQTHADCGLVKKEFDLAIGTDVKEARLTINGKETTYSYAQIMNGEMEDLSLDEVLEGISSDKNVTYNLYLYKSDYNYRIGDYKTDNSAIENNVNPGDSTNITEESLRNSKLKAYVTYTVILKAQTDTNAQVDEFVYYYDQKYTPMVKVGYIVDGYAVTNIENNKITFERKDNVQITSPNYRAEINIEFEVNDLKIENSFTNIAEITKYTTEGGLIDKDSAPGNAEVTYNESGTPSLVENNSKGYEDDTDKAKGITIKLRDGERTITGTVWDDGKFNNANGVKDGGENPEDGVNDVIVQLIEIKTIGEKNYEYIWQETRSGSGTVKKLSEDGNSITKQNYREAPNDGTYEFTGYIPGNYIIRFIYGDGTTYDITSAEYQSSAESVKKYNGQDYKSTIDPSYKQEWFNASNYSETKSVARDNEARRLQVMSDSTIINKNVGQSLENRTKEDLKNTWMAAETSKINIPIDADTKPTDNSNTTRVAYENIAETKVLSFADMNFGLALRPETKLILEKHITALKITPNGTGVQSIIDAKADISQIINNNIDVSGVTEGLATIKSTRSERGFWQVATDIEELAQGAQLEVEYTYVIRNDSDEDYLSTDLVSNYTNDVDGYSAYLEDKAKEVKGASKGNTHIYGGFLGDFYYTGKVPEETDQTQSQVLSRVETIEEALNNDLKFDAEEGTSGEDFKVAGSEVDKKAHNVEGEEKDIKIETVIQNTSVTDFLTRYTGEDYKEAQRDDNGNVTNIGNTDYSKTVTLRTVLASSSNGELGGNYQSYIAEIMQYSNAAGRRNMEAEPANLSYVNSENTSETMETSNEVDEFWGETIIITKPTGEDRLSALAITIIVISSLAVIAVGIVLIKKFVIKK